MIGVTAAERVAEQTIRETKQFHIQLLRDKTHVRNFWPRPLNLEGVDVGLGDLGLPMDSDDVSVGLSTESSSDDNARDVRVPLAAVPLTTLSNGESGRLQTALAGICWTFVFVYDLTILIFSHYVLMRICLFGRCNGWWILFR